MLYLIEKVKETRFIRLVSFLYSLIGTRYTPILWWNKIYLKLDGKLSIYFM